MAEARASSQADSLGGWLPEDCHRRQSHVSFPSTSVKARARARVRGLGHEGGVGCSPEGHSGWSKAGVSQEQRPEPVCGYSGRTLPTLSLPARGGGGHTIYQNSDPTRTLFEAMAVP